MGARFEAFAVAGCDITGTFQFFSVTSSVVDQAIAMCVNYLPLEG
jgi:hypothetical protein